jgi:hypothetical protein
VRRVESTTRDTQRLTSEHECGLDKAAANLSHAGGGHLERAAKLWDLLGAISFTQHCDGHGYRYIVLHKAGTERERGAVVAADTNTAVTQCGLTNRQGHHISAT